MRNFVQNWFRIDTNMMQKMNFLKKKIISCKTTQLLRKRIDCLPVGNPSVSVLLDSRNIHRNNLD